MIRDQTLIGGPQRVGIREVRRALDATEFLAPLSGLKRDKLLDGLIAESRLREYADGAVVLRQGEHGHSMFVLVRGSVRLDTVVDGAPRHSELLVTTPELTAFFGEGAVLGRTLRPSTCTSVGPSVLLELEKVRIEKLDNLAAGVIDALAALSERRTIRDFLTQHRAFSALEPGELEGLLDGARVRTAERHEEVFAEGSPAKGALVVKSGVAKLERRGAGGTSVLAYFSAGDVVGLRDGATRPGALVAMGFVELIELDKGRFDALVRRADARLSEGAGRWSDQLDKAHNARNQRVVAELSSRTGMLFVEEFMQEGAQIAQSLLTIDLDLCTRCGNCVVACESRHGHAKMTRRGKRLERRRGPEDPSHQPLLLPSSCRHCESPECMIGCPTGAIHRKLTGEVAIHEFCIGCASCALRCPWDNITMVETPDRWVLDRVTGQKLATPTIASKCDLCAGYDEANCVHNCPTKAILRVEPSYFPEVRQMIGGGSSAADGRTEAAAEPADHSRAIVAAIALAFALSMTMIYASARVYRTASPQGVALGAIALACMLGAASLSARRRLARLPRSAPHPDRAARPEGAGRSQLGPFYLWARAHVWLGGLSLLAVALHSRLELGGVVTSLLVMLLSLQVLTGLFGLAFSKWVPRVITRLEGDAQVEEDVLAEREALLTRRRELLRAAPEEVRRVAARARLTLGTRLERLTPGYDREAVERALGARIASLATGLGSEPMQLLAHLAADAARLEELKALATLYRLRRAWLSTHLTVTAMLAVFVVVHVGSVARFYLRLG